MADLIGQQLGQYEIVAVLGKGGMATVYRARQLNIEREVAIKVIKSDLVDNPDFIRRFRREAETLASLNHRHILKLFDYGQQGDIAYLVMELLSGGSLADLIEQGKLPPAKASQLLDQTASALDYAHRRGIVHRDLKPHNVLLDEDGNAVLTDFGIVKLLGDATTLTQSGTTIGTPAYMAPEQWRGEAIDARTDIYALGIILFEMLAGRLPFVGDTPYTMMHLHVNEPPPPLRSLNPYLPSTIEPVINKALAKNPDQRYESASALAKAFKEALGSPAAQQTQANQREMDALATVVAPTESRPNRRLLPLIGGALAVLLIIGAIALLSRPPGAVPTEAPGTVSPLVVGAAPTKTTPASAPTATPVLSTSTQPPALTATTDLATFVAGTRNARQASTANAGTIAAGVGMTDTAEAANVIASYTKTPTTAPTATPTRTASPSPTETPTATAIPTTAILYQTDFEDGQAAGWIAEVCPSRWQVITEASGNHAYQGSGTPECAPITHIGLPSWKDYAVELRFKRVKVGNLTITIRTQDFDNHDAVGIYAPFGSDVGLRRKKTGDWTVFNQQRVSLQANNWNTVHIEVRGDLIRASINGRDLPEAHDNAFPSGYLGLIVEKDTTMLFDDIRVWALTPIPTPTAIPTTAILYQTDFEEGFPRLWVRDWGDWQVMIENNGNRAYRGSGGTDGGFARVGLSTWKDYAVEFRFKRFKGSHLEVTFRTRDINNFYGLANFEPDSVSLVRKKDESFFSFSDQKFLVQDWNTVHIEVKGDLIRASINGLSLPEARDSSFTSGSLGLYVGPDTVIIFDDFRVWAL